MTQKTLLDYSYTKITFDSPNYPPKLRGIDNPPRILYAVGNISLLWSNTPTVAIVGTRKVSNMGTIKTVEIAKYFATKGYTIASGLALGVDTIAMKTALKYRAKVIAVLPCINNIVPKSNKQLAEEIVKKDGLLISERMNGTLKKYYFVQRNRIISGISDIVVVVETDVKGGTMHTVKFAKKQGKNVLVADLPAPGNQKLIEEGFEVLRL
jgi:DNA processing protein